MSSFALRAYGIAALVMLVLFPVLVVLVAVGCFVAGLWLSVRGVSGAIVPLAIGVPVIVALIAALWEVLVTRRPKPLPGHELTAAQHPALWAELDQLGSAMGQPRPDRVVVLPIVNAFVTTASRRREVLIGYPLLAGLNRSQLRAVLAHEMGHLAHGHTRAGWASYRASMLLERTLDGVGERQVQRLIVGYYHLYLRISMSVLRAHEHQADVWSARLAGGPQAASAFAELARLEYVWDLLSDRYLPLAVQVGARPPVSEAIRGLIEARPAEIADAVARQLTREPSRWSTHPSDAERIHQLLTWPAIDTRSTAESGSGGKAGLAADEPAWRLLGAQRDRSDPDLARAALLDIEAAWLPAASAPAGWEQVVHQAEVSTARRDVRLVQQHPIGRGPDRRSSLREFLETLADDSGRHVASALIRDDLPRGYWQGALNIAAARAARAALLITLADQARARTLLRWDRPFTLEYLTPAGEILAWPPDLTLAGPLDPAAVVRALDRLIRDGVDVDAALITEPVKAALITETQDPTGN